MRLTALDFQSRSFLWIHRDQDLACRIQSRLWTHPARSDFWCFGNSSEHFWAEIEKIIESKSETVSGQNGFQSGWDTFRLVSPSRLAVVTWQVPSSVGLYMSKMSHGNERSVLTSTMSPHLSRKIHKMSLCSFSLHLSLSFKCHTFMFWVGTSLNSPSFRTLTSALLTDASDLCLNMSS